MIFVLRWLLGYVEFTFADGFTERFLNLCKINNISLWKVKNDGVKVSGFTNLKNLEKLLEIAEKSGMSRDLVVEHGLSIFLKKHKTRCGIGVGLLFAVVFISIMSSLIWNVNVDGNDAVKNKTFTKTLAELGVKAGSRKSKIDILKIQEEMLEIHPELVWVSLNIFGSTAQLEYTLAKKSPPIVDEKLKTNVVAGKQGKITLVEGYKGTNLVKEGDFVAKGSLLISGVIKNADNSESLVHGRGKVFAETKTEFSDKINLNMKVSTVKASDNRFCLKAFLLKLPIGFKKNGEFSENEILLKGKKSTLPLGIIREDYLDLAESQIKLTENQGKLLVFSRLVNEKRKNFTDAQLKNIDYSFSFSEYEGTGKLKIKAIENIAEEKTINVTEN